mmetsp:Transcript_12717/g.18757  ORF Transcript_12717/g.18757 Transcript_12717/m.18757 type:complete len:248 (-) Transcript_12717:198-941(-)|eukprot:CAMPEP_0113935512 /NCGR_PEP_ID=MMETSP1339-20121228/2661_1 /TAXON_ID=94617 /ORGANISM="Fibrocapsa japonica" /LENGTH=247 /DNA_ID=CAMNT_0000937701 /DNA_START=151 /DNA_END=897 /DNA_ORIENTATION=+ /assembly_acc=CAM_ASM_000762
MAEEKLEANEDVEEQEVEKENKWRFKLRDMTKRSKRNFFYGLLCPQCAYASARSQLDGSNWCFNCLFLNPCAIRNIVREGYGIEGNMMDDIILSSFCCACTSCQMLNEVQDRGEVRVDRSSLEESLEVHEWEQELWKGMFEDNVKGLFGCIFPTCTYAMARAAYDGSSELFNLLCVNPCLARNLIREGYGLKGNCMSDIFMGFCCLPCSATQSFIEGDSRGQVKKCCECEGTELQQGMETVQIDERT